jgi:ElaB/YqjD/DUF883 family membrane-anchored ribosome-binding protein
MNSANRIKDQDSGKTSDNEQQRYETLTEAEYLTHEAELAKTAIARTLEDLKSGVAKAGDVRLWTHHHPWAAVGVAAATGFSLAALMLGGGRRDANQEEEEARRRHLYEEAAKAPYDDYTSRRSPKVSDTLLGSLFNLARTALEASLLTAIRTEGVERAQQASCPNRAAAASAEHSEAAN